VRVLITLFVPLFSVHIDWSTSTLSPMLTGKLELLEIADATANFRKSIEPLVRLEEERVKARDAYQELLAQNSHHCPPRDLKRDAVATR
jgi:hypothetical protein